MLGAGLLLNEYYQRCQQSMIVAIPANTSTSNATVKSSFFMVSLS